MKKLKPFTRQLSLPLQPDNPVPVPAEKQRELEQILADLLLSVAGTDVDEKGRKLQEGVYDPRSANDRLLLGLKGTMNEFELHLFQQRSLEAMRQKARRGEFQCNLPAGYCWAPSGKIEIDPDRRVQQAIRSVFERFAALGSARQVLMEFRSQGIQLPVHHPDPSGAKVEWRAPVYHTILQVLAKNI